MHGCLPVKEWATEQHISAMKNGKQETAQDSPTVIRSPGVEICGR
jgi:hypothetical protein